MVYPGVGLRNRQGRQALVPPFSAPGASFFFYVAIPGRLEDRGGGELQNGNNGTETMETGNTNDRAHVEVN